MVAAGKPLGGRGQALLLGGSDEGAFIPMPLGSYAACGL